MGKYDDLSEREKKMLRRMGEAHREAETTSWTLMSTFQGTDLLAVDGKSLEDAPGQESFYFGLENKDYLSTSRTGQGRLQISLQQRAIEYTDYATTPDFLRWWEDRMDELAGDRTVWARLFWHLVSFGLGFLSAIVLRLLGWIEIGN